MVSLSHLDSGFCRASSTIAGCSPRRTRRIRIDADTDPAFIGGDVVNPVRRGFAEFGDLEVMHPNRFRLALASRLAATIPKIANQFLLLRVNGDRWLIISDGGFHCCIDMLKLRVAVRIAGTFTRLLIGLTTVFQLTQQVVHQFLADFEPLSGQRRDDVALASADPTERRFRIAADGVLNQGLQRGQKGRLPGHRCFASTARPPDLRPLINSPGPQISDAAVDGAARDPGRHRRRRDTTITRCQGLVGHEKAPAPFIKERGCCLITPSDVVNVEHTA